MSPRRRSDPGKDVRLERLQNILGMAFVAIGLPVRMPLARHFLEGPARRLSLGARVDTVRQYASRLQMASAGVGETHIRVYPERQGLLLAGVAVVVAPAAAAGRNAQRACTLGFTCVFFSFRDGLEPSENVNWRRERESKAASNSLILPLSRQLQILVTPPFTPIRQRHRRRPSWVQPRPSGSPQSVPQRTSHGYCRCNLEPARRGGDRRPLRCHPRLPPYRLRRRHR